MGKKGRVSYEKCCIHIVRLHVRNAFLSDSKLACDFNDVQRRATRWLVSSFIGEFSKADLLQLEKADKRNYQQEYQLITSCQAISYLLQAIATDGILDEVEAQVTDFKQPILLLTV